MGETGSNVPIRLTKEERLLLLQAVPLSEDLRQRLEVSTDHAAEIWMSKEEADALRERVAEVLQARGFNSEYGLTPTGVVLEGLIDKLFTD